MVIRAPKGNARPGIRANDRVESADDATLLTEGKIYDALLATQVKVPKDALDLIMAGLRVLTDFLVTAPQGCPVRQWLCQSLEHAPIAAMAEKRRDAKIQKLRTDFPNGFLDMNCQGFMQLLSELQSLVELGGESDEPHADRFSWWKHPLPPLQLRLLKHLQISGEKTLVSVFNHVYHRRGKVLSAAHKTKIRKLVNDTNEKLRKYQLLIEIRGTPTPHIARLAKP